MGQMRNDLAKIQEKQKISLLKRMHKVCKKNKIKYWLIFGTLLGCVRENRFISWDSDIDIAFENIDLVKKHEKDFLKEDIKVERRVIKGVCKSLSLIDMRLPEETSMRIDAFEFIYFRGHMAFKWTLNYHIIPRVADTIHHICTKEKIYKSGVLTVDQMRILLKITKSIPNPIKNIIGKIFEQICYFSTIKRIMVFPETKPLLIKVNFYGIKVNIPVTYETHLVLNYGENWIRPDPEHHESHKIVGVIDGCQIVASSLDILKGEKKDAEIFKK